MKVTIRGAGGDSEKPELGNASWGREQRENQTTAEASKQAQPDPEEVPPVNKVRKRREPSWEKAAARKRKKRGGRSRQVNLVLALVLLTLIAFSWRLLVNSEQVPERLGTPRAVVSLADLDQEFEALLPGLEAGPPPHEVAIAFVKTSDLAERLRLCREPQRVASLLSTFPAQAVTEIAVSGIPIGEVIAQDLLVHRFEVLFANGEKRILFVVRTPEGPKVDWEAFARSCSPLQRWMNEIPDQRQPQEETAEVRIHLDLEEYYNYRFGDDEWQSYLMTSPDLEEGATAYVRRGTPSAKILQNTITAKKRVTLLLRSRPDDSQKKQFEIASVRAVGWVKAEGNFEERWLACYERTLEPESQD